MFPSGSARPPIRLVALIIGITVVPMGTLVWLGWRLVEQDRVLESQQIQQRVERGADLVVAALQRAITTSEQRLTAGSEQWPDGAVMVVFREGGVQVFPRGGVAYFPVVPPLREAADTTFARGEDLEFRQHNPAGAIDVFR